MKLLLFLFGAALAAGLYFVLADLLKIPRLATERALISAGRKERSLVKSMETLVLGWSLKLAPLIRLDAYKRRRLETKLAAAGLDMTPAPPRPLSFWTKCEFYSPRTRRYRVPQAGCTPLTANSSSTVTNRTPRGCSRSTISRAAVTLVG